MTVLDRRRFLEWMGAGVVFPGAELMRGLPPRSRRQHQSGLVALQSPAGRPAVAANANWWEFSTVYFTYPTFGEKITREQIRRKVRDAAESGSQVLMFFIMHEGYALYDSKVTERYPYTADFDVLAEVVESARAHHLKVIPSWMGVHGVSLLEKQHPSWRWTDSTGKPGIVMCLNSPFQNLLAEQVKEVITRHPVDGVYFDGLYAKAGGCYCAFCREKYKKLHGQDLPKEPDDPQMTDFRMQTVEGACRTLRSLLNENAPGALMIMDTLGVRVYNSFAQDLTQLKKYVDVFVLEAYWEYTGQPIWYVGMERQVVGAETRKPVWFPRWFSVHPDNDLAPIPNATIRLWAGESMVHAASPICVEQDVFEIDRSRYPTVKNAFQGATEIAPYLRGARRLPYAALLHSVATKEYLSRTSTYAYTEGGDPIAREMHNFQGTYMALLENHVPFEVITEQDIGPGLEKRFKVLVLPNSICISSETIDSIRAYVEAGGALVASYRAASLDQAGNPRDRMGLADLLGIDTLGLLIRHRGSGPSETSGGREATTYFRIPEDWPIGGGLEGRFSSFRGGLVRAAVRKGARVVASVLDYDYAKQSDPKQWWTWWPGQPSYPLVVTNDGPGRRAYIAGELDFSFWQHGLPESGRLIANTVRWAGGESPIEVEAPGTVQAEVYQSPALSHGFVCTLSNRSANPLYLTNQAESNRQYHYVREVIPVHDVAVKIRVGAGTIKEAKAISGRTVTARSEGGIISIRVPVLTEYDVIVVRWEE